MSELIGTLIAGKYRVKRRVGVGGMGAVYEAEQIELGKRVAVKVIEHQHARTPELAARFKREARAASAVESEHIVHVFDVGTDEAAGLYMVMELLAGEDVASRLERGGGRLPVEESLVIAVQAARGLARAHAAGVVHRDLKPANLFLSPREDGSPCVKLLDFGISKLVRPEGVESTASSSLTREGAVMGTPMYMSPEQAQGLAVDARTDVWSLGAVIYEMLAGRSPYEARPTYEMMIVQIVTQKPKPLGEVAPWVPAAVCAVVDGALGHGLEARTADAATLARQLGELLGQSQPSWRSSELALGMADTAAFPSSGGRADVASAPTAAGVVVPSPAAIPARGRLAAVMTVAALGVVGVGFALVRREPPAASAGIVQVVASSPPPAASSIAPPSLEPMVPVVATASAPSATSAPATLATSKVARPATGGGGGGGGGKHGTPPAQPQYGSAGLDTTYK